MTKIPEEASYIHHTINITDVITHIIAEIINAVPLFHHININKVCVCIASNKKNSHGGTYGKLVPLRFEKGSQFLRYKGRIYKMPEIIHNKTRLLYLIYFYMPKFFDLPAQNKLKVIFHEMYHISPLFNGDIRRMGKVKAAHGHSKKHFDAQFTDELDTFYNYITKTPYMKFLDLNSEMLHNSFKKVKGTRMKMPKPHLT